MESAPSSEHVQVITYLHQKGFDYSSERALVEACKDLKTFVNILKELTDDIQPNFTKAWLAVEGYSFTTDV